MTIAGRRHPAKASIPERLRSPGSGIGRPGKEGQAALAAKDMYVGRIWPAWPNSLRITVGTPEEMTVFRRDFTEVMNSNTAGLVAPNLPGRLQDHPHTHLS